jgi:hypothetical protein
MNKQLKLLVVSLVLVVLGLGMLAVTAFQSCTSYECQQNKQAECWSKYTTEDEAINACEKHN